jgi:Tfp pilus assembly protein PilF
MMDMEKAEALYNEYNSTVQERDEEESENTRLAYIQQGKELLLKKEYQPATELFEKAFALKVDKDVFVFLAHIYKIQKRTKDLQDLMIRWKEMINKEGIRFEDI